MDMQIVPHFVLIIDMYINAINCWKKNQEKGIYHLMYIGALAS